MDFQRQLAHASSEEELYAVLKILEDTDVAVTEKLDRMVSSTQNAQEHDIQRLDLLRTQLGTALSSSHEISKMLATAAYGATNISSKVRSIDAEKNRVSESLQYVEDVISLRSSVVGCHDSMDARDWEKAAQFIHRANSLPEDLVSGEFAKAMVPTSELPDYPRDTINAAAESLGNLFLREFGKAANAKDMENVTRYFKLFPLIGQEKTGLDVYAKFICGIITTHSRTLMQSGGGDSNMFYGVAMSRLFENIALIVSQHAPIVERHYGKGRMSRVVGKIQDEADSQGGLIMDTFWDERRIERLLNEIEQYEYPFLLRSLAMKPAPEEQAPDLIDLKHVNSLLSESSIMMNRWTLYRKFLAVHWNDFEAAPETDTHHQGSTLLEPQLLVTSSFAKKLRSKIVPAYKAMSTFVFRRSIEKAFQLEDLPDLWQSLPSSDVPLVSSTVSDVMLVLSSLLKQTLGTGEVPMIKDVIITVRRILESDFVSMVRGKLRDGAPRQAGPTLPSKITRPATPPVHISLAGLSSVEDKRLRTFMVNVNNLSTIADYTEQVIASLDLGDISFKDDAEEVHNQLQALVTSFKGQCTELAVDGLRTIFNYVLKPKLNALVNNVTRPADYLGQDDDDDDYDMSAEFALGWDALMSGFSSMITQENYTKLLSLCTQHLSKSFERWIWSLEGRVSEMGAIKLDRDVGRVITKASERYHFREKFVRVAQIVTVIGLDDAEDEEAVGWALTEDERLRARKILNVNY